MCGRFSMAINKEEFYDYLYDQFDIDEVDPSILVPRYNVAPGQNVITVIHDGERHRVGEIKWGFVPHFAKDEKVGYKMINARSETVDELPSFKRAFQSKRCVVLADGYYEWSNKVPYRVIKDDKSVFPMAGLWEQYIREDGTKLYTCTILTTKANKKISEIHDRMPVILDKQGLNIWLNQESNYEEVKGLLEHYESGELQFYEVSTFVNNASNEGPACIEKIM